MKPEAKIGLLKKCLKEILSCCFFLDFLLHSHLSDKLFILQESCWTLIPLGRGNLSRCFSKLQMSKCSIVVPIWYPLFTSMRIFTWLVCFLLLFTKLHISQGQRLFYFSTLPAHSIIIYLIFESTAIYIMSTFLCNKTFIMAPTRLLLLIMWHSATWLSPAQDVFTFKMKKVHNGTEYFPSAVLFF